MNWALRQRGGGREKEERRYFVQRVSPIHQRTLLAVLRVDHIVGFQRGCRAHRDSLLACGDHVERDPALPLRIEPGTVSTHIAMIRSPPGAPT